MDLGGGGGAAAGVQGLGDIDLLGGGLDILGGAPANVPQVRLNLLNFQSNFLPDLAFSVIVHELPSRRYIWNGHLIDHNILHTT